jgi:hypothetical protein
MHSVYLSLDVTKEGLALIIAYLNCCLDLLLDLNHLSQILLVLVCNTDTFAH